MPASGLPHDWPPAASWEMLRLRARLLQQVRAFFDARGFLEVETPLLSAEVAIDRHLDPFEVRPVRGGHPAGERLWLQTSPEFHMKRLMAAGGEAIFQIAHVFRQAEYGALHNPEFTMVEWYRRGDGLPQAMDLTDELCQTILGTAPAVRRSYAEAWQAAVGLDLHQADAADLAACARAHGISVGPEFEAADRDTWLHLLFAELVQPALAAAAPDRAAAVIVSHFPASQAALAEVAGEPPVAERFELFVNGIELANGYNELRSAAVLRQRNQQQNDHRHAAGKPRLPDPPWLLAAMEAGLPPCAGVALGFDRLVMLAAGASSLAEVLAFPAPRS
ncbi:MAG: EF-P lysine aminoacylase GenX [Pirellulales bacterium]|nr:EF-P lysine aminoacylase GenX [Pirellulales bacterium]